MEINKLNFLFDEWNEERFKKIDSYFFRDSAKILQSGNEFNGFCKTLVFPLNKNEGIGFLIENLPDFNNVDHFILAFDILGFYKGRTNVSADKIVLSQHIEEILRLKSVLFEIISEFENFLKDHKKIRLLKIFNRNLTFNTKDYAFSNITFIENKLKSEKWEKYLEAAMKDINYKRVQQS